MGTKKTSAVTIAKACTISPGTAIEFTTDTDKSRFNGYVKEGVAVKRFQLKVGMKVQFTTIPKNVKHD